jgi:hypothetical protein
MDRIPGSTIYGDSIGSPPPSVGLEDGQLPSGPFSFWLPSPLLVRMHPKVRRNLPLDHDGPSGAKTHFVSFGTPHTHFQKKRSIEGAALSNATISPSGKW